MSAAEQPFSEALAAAGPGGALRDLFARLGVRGHGLILIAAGALLLLPFAWGPPQIAGMLLLLNAGRLWARQGAAAPLLGGVKLGAGAGGGLARAFAFAEGAIRPRLADWAGGFGGRAAAFAMLLAAIAAFAPTPHLWLALGVLALGFGLCERDGLASAAGVAVCVCAGVYLVTMLAGLALGADFAAAWADARLPYARAEASRP
ncbi:MAG: exopolysaccharide biosynthesis protein [Hyphomonadaceae bacterium]